MNIVDYLGVSIGKAAGVAISLFRLGAGATWPGEIVLRLRPNILQTISKQHPYIIIVAGTNGKTTTSKMIETILIQSGKKVVRNESGANLDNGIVSTFLRNLGMMGKLKSKYFIFEVDEATVPVLLKQFHPQLIILLNLFRDQLDRYGEVDTIAAKWLQSFATLPKGTKILINGDDPQLTFIGYEIEKLWDELPGNKDVHRLKHPQSSDDDNIQYFGLDDNRLYLDHLEHATDSIYCPNCGNRLTFGGVYFSHLGKWACGKCGFMHPDLAITNEIIHTPLEGVYNKYNTLAAWLTARQLGIPDTLIQQALSSFIPAFGRMEEIIYQEKKLKILLSKNPTGWNESLRTMLRSDRPGPLLLVLNDRIPDGTDVSWIWDIDMEILQQCTHKIIISGDRCYDLALRLKYAEIPTDRYEVVENLETAIQQILRLSLKEETIWVLPTYSAMLDVRQILVGRKIL